MAEDQRLAGVDEVVDVARAATEAVDEAQGEAAQARDRASRAEGRATQASEDLREAVAFAEEVLDETADLLISERRSEDHPQQFGRPGRPMQRNSPFYLGFVGALGVLLAWALVQAIANARSVLVLIVVSIFLAVGLNPLVEGLMRRGLRRSAAVGVVFVLVILGFVGFASAVVPPLVDQTRGFVANFPAYLDHLQRSATIERLNDQFGIIDNLRAYITSGRLSSRAFGGLLGVGKIVLGTVFSALTVLILTLYFLASLPSIKRQAYRLAPASRRERVTLLGDEILARTGSYVGGAFVVASIAGLSSYLFLAIMGINYALPLSLFVGLMCLVPMIGATVAAVVVSGVAFFESVQAGIACLIFYTIYQQVENYLLYPRVMRRSVDVPAAATVIAALLGGALLGVVGALLAIPIAAALLLIVREVVMPRQAKL